MAKTEAFDLFAYGTLMFPEVWERVVGKPFASEHATLDGYVVRRVANDVYPVLIHGNEYEHALGVVFRDIDDQTLAKLDAYESDLYDRIAVTVELATGDALQCQAYVLPDRKRQHASDEPWAAGEFSARQLTAYSECLR